MAARKKKAGVIGLGSMGIGVARTLLKKGFEVHAFDTCNADELAINLDLLKYDLELVALLQPVEIYLPCEDVHETVCHFR